MKTESLLVAAVAGPDAIAHQSWLDWLGANPRNDQAQKRLCPLVYSRFGRHVVGGEILHQSYQAASAKSLRQRHFLKAFLKEANSAGVVPLLLKGAALSHFIYQEPAHRPMQDIDVWVPPESFSTASAILVRLGYHQRQDPDFHAETFLGPEGIELDLHRYVLNECRWGDADQEFYERSLPTLIGDSNARILSPCDQLLHVCVHGVRSAGSRWLVDAAIMIEQTEIDWLVLRQEAYERKVLGLLQEALGRLDKQVKPLPNRQLLSESLPLDQLFSAWLAKRARGRLFWNYFWQWILYCRATEATTFLESIRQFPMFLRRAWLLDSGQSLWSGLSPRIRRKLETFRQSLVGRQT